MRVRPVPWLLLAGILAVIAPGDACGQIAPNSLRLARTPSQILLGWQHGTPPYGIYRAEDPRDVTAEANYIDATDATDWAEEIAPLTAGLYFYRVAAPVAAAPTCALDASPDPIELGGASTLTWTSTDGATAEINGRPVALDGSLDVHPIRTTEYILVVTPSGGGPPPDPAVCRVLVHVDPPPPCGHDTPCIVDCGSGVIDDILTGETLWLDGPDMVHVLLLPEGYTSTELAAGVFNSDVQNWIGEWENIEPYSTFREAFCIWSQPRVSNEHVAPAAPQTADTAFLVPITDGAGVDSDIPITGPTSQRMWDLVLATFPFPPTSFYPAGGRPHEIAKNLVVAVMIYNPATGRSGLSGRSRRLENPADGSQRISAAFAHNRPHEFSHAFSRLRDEYIEDCCGPMCGNVAPPFLSQDWTNVVCSPACDDLPWAHLIAGGPINPGVPDLVGAFGVQDIGYHPEFKCLMNGTHDNSTYYGGNGRLRVYDRFCNFCRENTLLRLFERIHVLDDPLTAYDIWATEYRDVFYSRFGFDVPDPVPQENNAGTPFYEACTVGILRPPWTEGGVGGCDIEDVP